MGAENVSNKLSTLSQLSPLQVDEVNKKRKQYLSQMPSMDDEKAKELIQRNLGAIGIEVHNAYLSEISSLYLPIEEKKKFDAKNRIAYFEITRWVKDPNEDNIEIENKIKDFISNVRNLNFEPTPSKKACEYCPYTLICKLAMKE